MKRILTFAKRCFLENIRDPLSYIFVLGFPLLMLAVMSIINGSIPSEAGLHIFDIVNLAPAICVFGLSFVMLFTALLLSKDRSEAFLIRLYISPMTSVDFMLGYTLPALVISLLQSVITTAVSAAMAAFSGEMFGIVGIISMLAVFFPAALLFIGFGLLFGSLLNDKSAPPLSSIIISAASLLGGMWMDVDTMGGGFADVCHALPFYHAVTAGRMALSGSYDGIIPHIAVVSAWAVAVFAAASAAFHFKRRT